jgi:hypothetical protein
MARIPRIVAVNIPHHVTQRGNAPQFILSGDTERLLAKKWKCPVCPRFLRLVDPTGETLTISGDTATAQQYLNQIAGAGGHVESGTDGTFSKQSARNLLFPKTSRRNAARLLISFVSLPLVVTRPHFP